MSEFCGGCEPLKVCEDDGDDDGFAGGLLEGSMLGCKQVICSTRVSLSLPQMCHAGGLCWRHRLVPGVESLWSLEGCSVQPIGQLEKR